MKIVLYKPLGEEYNIELPSVGGNEKRPENSFKKSCKKVKKVVDIVWRKRYYNKARVKKRAESFFENRCRIPSQF